MSKVIFNVYLEENNSILIDNHFNALFNDNLVKYKDSVINIFDFKSEVLKRISDSYEIVLCFNGGNSFYKDKNVLIPIDIDVLSKVNNFNSFIVRYKQNFMNEEKEFLYKLEVVYEAGIK